MYNSGELSATLTGYAGRSVQEYDVLTVYKINMTLCVLCISFCDKISFAVVA